MKKADPRLMLIMSMTVFGTLGLFVRNISVSSGELALYRAVLAALLIGVYLLVSRQKIPFARIKKEVPLLLLSGAAMGVNWILLFEAYRYTTIAVATLCYYMAPVLLIAFSPLLIRLLAAENYRVIVSIPPDFKFHIAECSLYLFYYVLCSCEIDVFYKCRVIIQLPSY